MRPGARRFVSAPASAARGPRLRSTLLPLWLVSVWALGLGVACAGLGGPFGGGGAGDEDAPAGGKMDQARLEQLFAAEVSAITGPPGAIQTVIDGVKVYCISDPQLDRMRLVAPIAPLSQLDTRALEVMLRANFQLTEEARFALSEEGAFATFQHPISTLEPDRLRAAISEVVSLVRDFGALYSEREDGGSGEAAPDPGGSR